MTSSESVDMISLYSQKFANRLEAQGILGHHFPENKTKLRVPDNFETIKSFIQKPRKSPEPTEYDYKKYAETLFRAGSCENKIYTLFNMFFDVPILLENGHLREIQQKWTKIFPIGTQDIEHRPRPGYAEGLKTSNLPQWVRTRLGSLITFNEQINLPNFIVELKREGSQLKAHQQNIYNGAFGSQAYHSYYEHILQTPDESWDMAKVGTLVFDGDTVVGNVHWVSKSPNNEIRDRDFLVARVFCHFTLGTGLEDFRTARRAARNFHDYFRRVRSDLRRDCAELINPAAPKDESDGLSSFTSSGS